MVINTYDKAEYIKQKKKKEKKELLKFTQKIIKNKNDLPKKCDDYYTNINNNSWFNTQIYDVNEKCEFIQNCKDVESRELIKCQKIVMKLTEEQKQILNKWFNGYTEMYNEGIKYIFETYNIKKCGINKTELINELNRVKNTEDLNDYYNFYNLRKKLYDIKTKIIEKTQIENINKNTKINTHTLDYALQLLCSNFPPDSTYDKYILY